MAQRLDSPDAFETPEGIARVIGPLASLERAALATPGFSGSSHERLDARLADGRRRSLVLKRTRIADDWVVTRTGDRVGREAALLDTPALAPVFEVFASPYLAYAVGGGELALLMDDLGPFLFPDVRAPLAPAQQHALLAALAGLHARFWESPALATPWLARPEGVLGLLHPGVRELPEFRDGSTPLFARVRDGWRIALERLPRAIADLLCAPPATLAERAKGLPHTLVHGDAKVANFAILGDGRVAAFDWAMVGAAPPALDLGWYLAVNASRITGTKEALIDAYRAQLEAGLGSRLSDETWERMRSLAVVTGAALLLWSKALALAAGGDPARDEWEWWVDRLSEVERRGVR